MTKFRALFGLDASEIKENCILLPLLPKGILAELKVDSLAKGKLFCSGNSAEYTIIQTGMGPAFTADAVLYLKETACKNIILFGSCGLVHKNTGLDIGSLVVPSKCWENESFSELLIDKFKKEKVFYPDADLMTVLLNVGQRTGVKEVSCATLGSLKLEEQMQDLLIKEQIDVVEMECSAFFAAAKYCKLKAAALFYVSDIISEKPFYFEMEQELKTKIASSIKSAVNIICESFKKSFSA
jgi:purine-nucleoside phosphorylase